MLLLEVLSQMYDYEITSLFVIRDSNVWSKEVISYEDKDGFSKSNFMIINQGLNKFYKKV